MMGRRCTGVLVGLVLSLGVVAQDLSIPTWWQDRNMTLSREERTDLAQSGLEVVKPLWTPLQKANTFSGTFPGWAFWDSGGMLWTMAFKDYVSNTSDNNNVTDAIEYVRTNNSLFHSDDANKSPLFWSMAAIYAYRAYKDPTMLSAAKDVWEDLRQYQIDDAGAEAGSNPKKNTSFSGFCNNQILTGGFFMSTKDDNDLHILGAHTAQFALLSAHLAELTNNTDPKYMNAAILSTQFVRDVLVDDSQLVIPVMVPSFLKTDPKSGVSSSQPCKLDHKAAKTSADTGAYLEALAVLANVTNSPKWSDLMLNSLAAAVKNASWISDGGVIVENPHGNDDDSSYKGKFIRSLYEPWARSNRSDVRELIETFINVQANSLRHHATTQGTNFYSANWTGPAATQFSIGGALAGLDLLAASVGPAPPSNLTSSSRAPSAASSVSRTSKLPRILGIAFGLVALIGLGLGVSLVFLRRRSRHTSSRWQLRDGESLPPYTTPQPPMQQQPAPKIIVEPVVIPVTPPPHVNPYIIQHADMHIVKSEKSRALDAGRHRDKLLSPGTTAMVEDEMTRPSPVSMDLPNPYGRSPVSTILRNPYGHSPVSTILLNPFSPVEERYSSETNRSSSSHGQSKRTKSTLLQVPGVSSMSAAEEKARLAWDGMQPHVTNRFIHTSEKATEARDPRPLPKVPSAASGDSKQDPSAPGQAAANLSTDELVNILSDRLRAGSLVRSDTMLPRYEA